MVIEENLKANINEYLESAERDFVEGKYNSAINSYFKAIAAMCDLNIYILKRVLPKNHNERFLFLKTSFNEVYELLSPLFKEYTKTYNLRMGKKEAMLFKENVERIKQVFERKI